ncbi:MAG: hypothetical protein HQK72_14135 [Desulfamplus sp.]|nr:hypothetical protein [Desulfamplus sp.]
MDKFFWTKINTIAFNVWRESIRDKAVTILISAFTIILLFFHIMGSISVNGDRLIQTSGLYIFGIFGVLVNIYLSVSFMQEINAKRFYIILVRPVSTFQFLAGKYIGMCMLLLTLFLLMSLIWFLFILSNSFIQLTYLHALTLFFIFAEWTIIAAASVCFALFTNPLLQSLIVVSLYFFGHHSNDIYLYAQTKVHILTKQILMGLYYSIPNLELMNFRTIMLYGGDVEFKQILSALMIALLWIAVFFTASCTLFAKKRFA